MDQFNFVQIGYQIGMYFVPFLFALCFHEFSHGLVAKWRGDNTAERMGRLTLNPAAHADPIGTWVLPLTAIILNTHFMFGWARPVPVDSRNLKRPKQDMFWVALAGPASNILLALLSTLFLAAVLAFARQGSVGSAFTLLLSNFILVNIFLAIFNLIPIHPLDGGKVIAPFLPVKWNFWLEQNQAQLSIALFVIILFAGGIIAIPAHWISETLLSTALRLAERMA